MSKKKIDVQDMTIKVCFTCSKCDSTGFTHPDPDIDRSCSHCGGKAGIREEQEISVLDLICSIEQYKQERPVELSKALKDIFTRKKD